MDITVKEAVQTLCGSFDKQRRDHSFIHIVISTLFINVLSLIFPLVILQTYDRVLPNNSMSTFSLLIIGLIIALTLETILRTGRSMLSAWQDARFEHLTNREAFANLLTTPLAIYETEGPGVHLERLSSLNTLKDFYAGQALITVLDLAFVLLFLSLMAYIGGVVVLVPLTMLLLFFLRTYHRAPGLHEELTNKRKIDDRKVNFIIEVLNGIHCIKSMAMEASMLRRYERLQRSSTLSNYELGLKANRTNLFITLVTQATLAGVSAIGSLLVISGHLSIGALAACILLAGRCLQPATKTINIWNRLQSIRIAEQRLEHISNLPKEKSDEYPNIVINKGEIILENISFHYEKSNTIILNQINLQIKPGEMIGIKGKGVSGKSTLLLLLMAIMKPTQGKILIDQQDISQYNVNSVRQQIAYIPQESKLFDGSILENLTLFRGPQYIAKAKHIADLLGLHSVITRMPMGYDSRVGDHAVEFLPRGIQQRIIIARALLDNPKIILLDEANTAIDMKSEEILIQVLKQLKGQHTIILIAHRPSLLALSDRVLELKQGTLT